MDLKMMPKSQKGHQLILCMIDEMTNYLITTPLYQARSEEIGEALIENIISKCGTPDYMMMDQDSTFMSSLMSYLFKKLGITIKTVGPYNHKSLQAEHGIMLCRAVWSNRLILICLRVIILHIIGVLQYTTAHLQILFSSLQLSGITKVLQ